MKFIFIKDITGQITGWKCSMCKSKGPIQIVGERVHTFCHHSEKFREIKLGISTFSLHKWSYQMMMFLFTYIYTHEIQPGGWIGSTHISDVGSYFIDKWYDEHSRLQAYLMDPRKIGGDECQTIFVVI